MTEDREREGRLPGEWLPDRSPHDDGEQWDRLAGRIVAAAAPLLDPAGEDGAADWQVVLGSWLRPAVALAAAAAIVAFAADRARPGDRERGQASLPLAVLAADGDPAVLWQSIGIEADPVLALIALQEGPR